jgi:hypothetical protein
MIVSGAEQAPHLRAPWISANKSRQNLPEFPVLYCTFQVNAHRYLSNLSSSLGQHTSSPPQPSFPALLHRSLCAHISGRPTLHRAQMDGPEAYGTWRKSTRPSVSFNFSPLRGLPPSLRYFAESGVTRSSPADFCQL